MTHSSVGSAGSRALSKTIFLVIAPELAESTFKSFANRRQGARNLADAVDVAVFLYRAGIDSSDWSSGGKEILDNFRDEPPFACLGRLAENGRQI